MSKVSFRARALDAGKPLPLYYEEELPDLSEYVAVNRAGPQIPTGMEKEEEAESHLQKVILARQSFKDTAKVMIPIPEAAIPVDYYSNIYHGQVRTPHDYIRVPGLEENDEVPDYDLDSEDDEWLSVQSKERPLSPTHFEKLMDKLEKGSGNTVLSDRAAQVLLKDDNDIVMAVYDYWLAKRLRLERPLIPAVRNERREGTSSSNPYLAFRKRMEKMQTRRNRKNDEHAYMQMLKLRRDLGRAVTLVELLKDREATKCKIASLQAEIFNKRYGLEDWSGSLVSSCKTTPTTARLHPLAPGHWEHRGLMKDDDDAPIVTPSTRRKRRPKKGFYQHADTESPLLNTPLTKDFVKDVEPATMEDVDGPFVFRRKVHIRYHNSHSAQGACPWGSLVQDPPEYGPQAKRLRFSETVISGRSLGHSCRRMGRGGRTMWDRTSNENINNYNIRLNDTPTLHGPVATPTARSPDATPTCHAPNATPTSQSSPRYIPVSPTLNGHNGFDFTYLTFIDPSTYPCPDLHKGYGEFGGMLLDDLSDEASSFSALPTSHFTLKPSSDKEQSINEWAGSQVKEDTPFSSRSTSLPATHLSSLESSLPVQIHVNTIKHVPHKDTPTEPTPTHSVPSHDTGSTPKPPLTPSIDHTSWDNHTSSTSLLLLNKPRHKSCKTTLSLTTPTKVTPTMATAITKLFIASTTNTSTSKSEATPITPRTPLPSPIIGHDPRRAATADLIINKDRSALSLSGTNHFKHSPNGTEYRANTCTKLQPETDALPSSAIGNHSNNIVENTLKLNTPSEVT